MAIAYAPQAAAAPVASGESITKTESAAPALPPQKARVYETLRETTVFRILEAETWHADRPWRAQLMASVMSNGEKDGGAALLPAGWRPDGQYGNLWQQTTTTTHEFQRFYDEEEGKEEAPVEDDEKPRVHDEQSSSSSECWDCTRLCDVLAAIAICVCVAIIVVGLAWPELLSGNSAIEAQDRP